MRWWLSPAWCRWSLLGLVALQPAWFGWLYNPGLPLVLLVLAVALAPLLLVLPGVWRLESRSLVIGGCLLLLYFCFAVMEAWMSQAARLPALVQVILISLYFAGLAVIRRAPARSD
jgi:uncharacterized membrane protein